MGNAKLTAEETKIIQKVININLKSWRYLGREECEDMGSMAWVKVLERLPRYDDTRTRLVTFVDCAVKSALLDWYRRFYNPRVADRKKQIATFNSHISDMFGDDTDLARRTDKISAESRLDLYAALETLEGRDREMAGYYLSGMTQVEMSRIYGLSEGRIAQCLKTITSKLKGLYGNIQEAQDSEGEVLAAMQENQALVPDDLDDATIARMCGNLDIQLALKKADFREWFLDVDSNAALIEAGVDSAIRRLIDIVEMSGTDLIGKDAEAKTGDQVRAAEMLLRYAGYGPAKEKEGTLGKDLDKMSPQELDSYISSKSKKLKLT